MSSLSSGKTGCRKTYPYISRGLPPSYPLRRSQSRAHFLPSLSDIFWISIHGPCGPL